MKIEQKKEVAFVPVVITLESVEELQDLARIVGTYPTTIAGGETSFRLYSQLKSILNTL